MENSSSRESDWFRLISDGLCRLSPTVEPQHFTRASLPDTTLTAHRADGGKITLDDMSRWGELIRVGNSIPEGEYRGHSVMSSGLITYALHLNEALDLKGSGPADSNPEAGFKQIRIMEEVFHATK